MVAAAFYPLAFVAERVAGDHAEVELLTRPGGEPHDLELNIEQTATIANADLVVYESGFQPGVDDAVTQNAAGSTLDAAAVVGLQPFAEHEEHEEHGEHDGGHHEDDGHDHEGDLDPHFWLDPLRLAELGDTSPASSPTSTPATPTATAPTPPGSAPTSRTSTASSPTGSPTASGRPSW